MKACSLWT